MKLLIILIFLSCLNLSYCFLKQLFDQSLFGDYSRHDQPKSTTKLFLYTRKEGVQELQTSCRNPLKDTNFNAKRPIRIIIHGWQSNKDGTVNKITKAYLKKGDFNVIVVDWNNVASLIEYWEVKKHLSDVADKVVKLLQIINGNYGVKYSDIVLIGHSLGAHLSGMIGRLVPEKLGVIVALDAAGPLFDDIDIGERLDPTDAIYVEGIQTDIHTFGYECPYGHAAFFPNYGAHQPGCRLVVACSHSRAIDFFAESINSEIGFYGVACNYTDVTNQSCDKHDKWYRMGGEPIEPKKGVYFLTTNKQEPFARGKSLK